MRETNLLKGNIFQILLKMAMPLMGIAFVQMAYQLVDLMWLGRLSTDAVASVGAGGFYIWMVQAITLISKTGISVGLAQAYGRKNNKEAEDVWVSGFYLNLFICLILSIIYIVFKDNLIGIYGFNKEVHDMAVTYLFIISIGLIFSFLNPVLSSSFYSKGNSITPFKIAIIALVFNIILDPILIFGISVFPRLEVAGAALATVIAQAIATFLYLFVGYRNRQIFVRVNYFKLPSKSYFINHLKLGVPASLQSVIHATVGIILNKYIASFGAMYAAVYSIGSQIESISWMTSEGFAVAFSAFFGQNYGAKNFDRLQDGRKECLKIINLIGITATLILFIFSKELFSIFIPNDPKAVIAGIDYLKILSLSQYFMALEIGTTGMLNGLGLTKYPAINAVILNILRIPIAFILMPYIGVLGVWAAMTISSVLKGIVLNIIYLSLRKKTEGFKIGMDSF